MNTNVKATHTRAMRAALRSRRQDLGLSQAALAARLGIESANYLSMLETGKTPLPIGRAPQIAAFLDVHPWEVIRAVLLESEGGYLDGFLPSATSMPAPSVWSEP